MSTLDITAQVDLMIASIGGDTEATNSLMKLLESAADQGVTSGLQNAAKKTKDIFAALNGAGLKKGAQAFEKASLESSERENKILKDRLKVARKLQASTDQAQKKSFKRELDHQDKLLKKERKHQAATERKAKAAAEDRQQLIDDHKKSFAAGKTAEGQARKGDAVGSAMTGAASAGDMSAAGAAGAVAGGAGSAMKMASGAAATAGMAGAASAMAAAAASIAIVAGPLVAIVGILAMAYGNAKDMNKSLMESASAFDLVGMKAGETVDIAGSSMSVLEVKLVAMRDAIVDLSEDWRMSSDEITGVAKALLESGITMKEMSDVVGGATGSMTAFKQVTKAAIVASQGLGIEVSSVAEFMEKMSRDLGYHLNGIQGAFGLIAGEAGKAKMRTADFFSAINEASSGMALYNFRVSDTVTLMTELVEILGEDLAKTKISGGGTFSGMGMQERYKQAMLGGSAMKGVAMKDATLQAKEFSGKDISIGGKDALKAAGLMGKDGQLDVKAMSQATGKEFRAVLASGKLTDVQERQLTSIRELAQAHKKGHGGTARALANLSKRGNIAAEFTQAASMFGGKMLSEMDAVQQMTYESVTGIGGEEFQVRMRLQEKMMAEFEAMSQEDKDKQGIKTFTDAVLKGAVGTEEEIAEASKAAWSQADQHAADSLVATRSISVVLKNKIGSYLHDINTAMQWLVGVCPWGSEEYGTPTQRAEMDLGTADNQIKRSRKLTEGFAAKDMDIGHQLSQTKAGADRDALLLLKEENQRELSKSERRTERLQEARAAMVEAGPRSGDGEGELDWSDHINAAGDMQAKEMLAGGDMAKFDEKRGGGGKKVQSRYHTFDGVLDPGTTTQYDTDLQAYGGERARKAVRKAEEEQGFDPKLLKDLSLRVSGDYSGDVENPLSNEEREQLAEQIKIADAIHTTEVAAAEASKLEFKETQKKVEEGAEDIVKQLREEGREDDMAELIALISESSEAAKKGGTGGVVSEEMMKKLTDGSLSKGADISSYLKGGGVTIEEAAWAKAHGFKAKVQKGPAPPDFIYRGNGQATGILTPLLASDELMGMKTGGAIDQVFGKGGKGGGKNVIVNISGGDTMRVYQVVRRVLSETGYGDTKQYG